MAELHELQKKFRDHRRWAADLLLKSETLRLPELVYITNLISEEEEIEALTVQLEQIKKKPLSAHQEQEIQQPACAENTTSLAQILNGLGKDGDTGFSSKEAVSSESALPATVPYAEYADMVQKLNLYRRNIQEKDRTLKR